MSKVVNRSGVSEDLFRVLSQDNYSRGDAHISATQLISPPRVVQLQERCADEIEEDASDLVYRMFGKITHEILEKIKLSLAEDNGPNRNAAIASVLEQFNAGAINLASLSDELQRGIDEANAKYVLEKHHRLFEHRFFAEVSGWNISGQVDDIHLDTGKLRDYKVCSVWVSLDSGRQEWTQQANIYAFLLRRNGIEVREAEIEALFRDWSKTKAARERTYPQSQTQTFPLELWTPERQSDFVHERVRLHQEAARASLDVLPMCSPEERWATDQKFAVEKKGRQRALKLADTREEADHWIRENRKEGEVFHVARRDGESTRCLHYCNVWNLCEFGRHLRRNNK